MEYQLSLPPPHLGTPLRQKYSSLLAPTHLTKDDKVAGSKHRCVAGAAGTMALRACVFSGDLRGCKEWPQIIVVPGDTSLVVFVGGMPNKH